MNDEKAKKLLDEIYKDYKYSVRARSYAPESAKIDIIFAVKSYFSPKQENAYGKLYEKIDDFENAVIFDVVEFVLKNLQEKNNH